MSGVIGWDEPEVLAEYGQAVEHNTTAAATPWSARARYITALTGARDALVRELDRAQLGDAPHPNVELVLGDLAAARRQYAAAAARARRGA